MQTENAHNIKVVFVIYNAGKYERPTHRIFDYLNVRGEWFKKHDDIYKYIETANSYPNEENDIKYPWIELGQADIMNDFKDK